MATFESAAESELVCGVCFHFFVKPHEPKNLPKCSHILCQICLEKMTEGGLEIVKCPQCNKISPLPEEGIGRLTTTLTVRNLAERHPEGIKQYKEYMQCQLKSGQEKTEKTVAKLKEVIKQTQNAIKIEEQEIEKAVEAVMIKAEQLVQQLKNTSGLYQLQEQLAKLEKVLKTSETTQFKLKTITDKEFHAETDAITNQIEKLKMDLAEHTTPCVDKFSANIQLGRLVKPKQLELLQEFGEFESATGIASNASGVLAVSDCGSNPQQVLVFQKDSTEYKQQRQFSVQQRTFFRPLFSKVKNSIDMPLDIAISENEKFLVTKCAAGIDIYSSDGKLQKTESVIDKQPGQGKMVVESVSICSTKDGRIMVGTVKKAESEEPWEYIVTVHDKEGSLMKTIPIGIEPARVTNINGTHVAVCDDDDKVCVYDMHTHEETLSIDVHEPCGICYDEQSDCLLIGRLTEENDDGDPVDGSGVIEQYCRISGKLVACLAHRLQVPFGLTITEDNMLAVADGETVKLYKMD